MPCQPWTNHFSSDSASAVQTFERANLRDSLASLSFLVIFKFKTK